MDPYNRFRLWLRRRWDHVEATMVDVRFVKRVTPGDGLSGHTVNEYMVDVPSPGGGDPVRLTFKEQTHRVRGNPERGDVVPVIANAKRTKAMFDYSDPRIDSYGAVHEQERRRKQADDERFEARRRER